MFLRGTSSRSTGGSRDRWDYVQYEEWLTRKQKYGWPIPGSDGWTFLGARSETKNPERGDNHVSPDEVDELVGHAALQLTEGQRQSWRGHIVLAKGIGADPTKCQQVRD